MRRTFHRRNVFLPACVLYPTFLCFSTPRQWMMEIIEPNGARCEVQVMRRWGTRRARLRSNCYSPIRLMDHRIMVQFGYWFKFRLVPDGMNNLLYRNIWLKVQNNLHNGSNFWSNEGIWRCMFLSLVSFCITITWPIILASFSDCINIISIEMTASLSFMACNHFTRAVSTSDRWIILFLSLLIMVQSAYWFNF